MARKEVKKIPSTAAVASSSSKDADDVLMQQFTRDLKLILRHVGDAKQHSSPPEEEQAESGDEVAYYGSLSHKLLLLVNRLLRTSDEQLAVHKKQWLLDFGDKFYAQNEFRAASRSFYARIVDAFEAQEQSSKPRLAEIEAYIRALYGQAMCLFQEHRRRDKVVRHPGTLEKIVEALRLLQRGMQIAVKHKSSWLVLNGSLLVFSIARPLCTLGFPHEVVAFVKYGILALESLVALSTTKFILWRLQLFALTCECYEAMSHSVPSTAAASVNLEAQYLKAALNCAEYAQKTVLRLKKEEELDLPLPKDVIAILAQAQMTASMLVARAKVAASHEMVSKRQIEANFASANVGERIRVAVDTVESLTWSDRKNVVGILATPSTPQLAQQISELLEFVLEMVTPLLPTASPPGAEGTAPGGDELSNVFPLAFHMMLLRHLYRIGKTEELLGLIKAAKARLCASSSSSQALLSESDRDKCTQELALFKALARIKTAQAIGDKADGHDDAAAVKHSPLQLVKAEITLPPASALLRLVKALTHCLNQGAGDMSHTNRDLILAVALLLWQQFALSILHEIDATDPEHLPKQLIRVASELLLACHLAFTFADLDDLLVHGYVGIRLTSLLQLQNKHRLAIQVLRAILKRINRKRDELALSVSHFQATAASVENSVALSCSTISCSPYHPFFRSDAALKSPTADTNLSGTRSNARDNIGVYGTGSQFGSLYQDLCCLQVDLVLLLYQVELEEASAVDALPSTSSHELPPSSSPFEPISLVKSIEEKLSLECRKSGYNKVLLAIQRMRHHRLHDSSSSAAAENVAIAEQAMKTLERIESQERELQARLKHALIATTTESHLHPHLNDSNVPQPPVVIARSSSAMTVHIPPFVPSQPSLRKRKVAYYMVFAKPSGAGTAVSLNNNELPGTSEPVFAPHLQVTISGLIPNESYVFAVAAFDHNDEVIQGIGLTSEPVVALHPLSVSLCYGYLAQACYELELIRPSATKAAAALYNSVVSRDASSRALWKASPFYRHALKREIIAKLPIPILNMVVQAIMILTHDESGDPERDGAFFDPEHRSLLSRQTDVIEASRKVAIGVELASAAANSEAIRVLAFKGYRVLLPLLHLHQCNGLTFAPLMTFYQALLTIPRAHWDIDTKSIFARISFELFRVTQASRHFIPVVYPSLVNETLLVLQHQPHESEQHNSNTSIGSKKDGNEYRSLCEAMAIQEVLDASAGSASTLVLPAATSPAKHPPPPAAAPATKAAPASTSSVGTPQSTPRQPGPGGENAEPKLPPLTSILQQANSNLADVLKALETHAAVASSDVQYIEYVCKIGAMALQRGDDSTAEACLVTLKLKGSMSERFREVMTAVGGDHLLPECSPGGDNPATVSTSPVETSPPTSARSVKSPRQAQHKGAKDEPALSDGEQLAINTPSSPRSSINHEGAIAAGGDDDFLYLWVGEVFFLQALLQFRKLVHLRETRQTPVDAKRGPSFDSTFEILHSGHIERCVRDPEPKALAFDPSNQEQSPAEPSVTSAIDDGNSEEILDVFAQFLEKMAAACELFRCGKAWQALQASSQYVWNAVWVAWLSPDRIGASSPAGLDRLTLCVDALLDMVEAVVLAVKEQRALGSSVMPTASGSQIMLALNRSPLQTSMASTVVVSSAMNAMAADVTWIVNFVSYALKACCAQEKWETIVRIGRKFHLLMGNDERGGRFSERNFSLLIFAQRQLVDTANTILTGAERELATFVRDFTESEAKKKKKKSRLVVEEVLTPEELDFRAKRAVMEDAIHLLTKTRNRQRDEMQQLAATHESLTKSMNKCVQALDAIHELVETYHRADGGGQQQQLALKNQIVSAYNHCILLSHQKRQQRLVCQAYQEMGDFYLACTEGGNTKLAVKNWHECLDNALGALNVVQSWREVLARSSKLPNGVSGAEQIQGDGLWITLISCNTLSKLVMHATSTNCFQAVEYSLMAAKIFTRLFASSLPHPTRDFLYGSYELGNDFWPGRDLVDPERVSSFPLALFFIIVPEVLLRYESYAETAMPVIAGYEYIARYYLERKNHVANARRLRVEALSQCGRISEAITTFVALFDGVEAASLREIVKPNSILTPVTYHDSKPLRDDANAAALAWFTALDVPNMHAELTRTITSEPLVLEILVTILRLIVRLSRHESNLADGSSPIRSVAEKIAYGLLQLLDQSQAAVVLETDDSQAKVTVPTWENVHSASVRGEVLLQQSYLAYYDGQWSLARDLSGNAMEACMDTHQPSSSSFNRVVFLDLKQELKFCLFRRPSTSIAKCRLQSMRCDLAQGRFHAVLGQAEVALHECRETGEDHLSEQIQVLCVQALVFLGKRDAAESDLEKLRATAISRFTNCNLTFVHSLLMASTVLRAKVLLTRKAELLGAVKDRLIEAERILDGILERSGWIGVDSTVDQQSERRINLYNPGIPIFILVKTALAQTLVECAIDIGSETSAQRQTRVLRLIERGLRATLHTTRRVGSAKALLLLLKGAVLKKILTNQHSQSQQLQHKEEATHKHAKHDVTPHASPELMADDQVVHLFTEAVTSLTECIETSIHSGGYDRRLVRMALIELVYLYGQKLIHGNEDKHVQAAYHYLSLAVQVQSHEFVLFETLELQSGTITSLDKLPPFILSAINDGQAAPPPASTDKKGEPPAATTAKKAGSAAVGTGGGDHGGRPPPPDAVRLINYYLRLQREQHVLPACTAIQQETVQWLHTFLLQNHSSYAKSCCLTELPKVRTEDPEIKASLVCAQWGKDLTPAIHTFESSGGSLEHGNGSAARLTLYFTLGTTRIDILCNEELVAAATSRMEDFLRGPLLSKRPGLDERQINTIRTQLSHLRARMEDDESLVIDRTAFESELLMILHSIQHAFRHHSGSTRAPDSSQSGHDHASSSAIVDVFGNPISLPCTLETVRSLEDLFTVQKGLSLCENVLCYFLRDLLELEA